MSAASAMEPIAVIGMTGRFPRAANLEEFWRNLRDGVECLTFFSDAELAAAGVDPEHLADPRYVRSRGVIDGADLFDAAFFGFSPREAEIMDPQHRIFLESAWRALEDAGYAPGVARNVGVYAGASLNSYLLTSILHNPGAVLAAGSYQAMLANDKDYLATRAAYKLNLRGPAVVVQTACSTSLVAVQMACRALQAGECEIALAGGVSVLVPRVSGYLYEQGMILSPDGHCRAFDAAAQGTVAGEGVGVVVLKRLADAQADRDHIRAVIRGAAINNDGSNKVGYTAPSVDGQLEVIAAAHRLAGVDPDTIGYVEAHGTGTELGDPIEIAALHDAFRRHTERRGFCAIGSVKTNLGHLDAAAGVAGLIKAVLALEHRTLPPSLHFERPNPRIDFDASPFYVNTVATEWRPAGDAPLRAGVSSFGIGGTNAHVVLEEAPARPTAPSTRPVQVLTLSARSPESLDRARADLTAWLDRAEDADLADVAYTLHTGRASFPNRCAIVARDRIDAVAALHGGDALRHAVESRTARPIVFLFSGQGTQYVGMGRGLYRTEPAFREVVDECADIVAPLLGFDLRSVLFPEPDDREEAARRLATTAVTQPALFTIEYALARLLIGWGIAPHAMIGHSIGEYVAACVAGVMEPAAALRLVTERGRLMEIPGGAMLAVPLPEEALRSRLPADLSIAAVNGAALCAVSGPADAVAAFAAALAAEDVQSQPLHVASAFHSAMMEPALAPFRAHVERVRLSEPRIPYASNVTGGWITPDEACDPGYWASHIRQPVRFWDGLRTVAAEDAILLEVGPGRALASLARPIAAREDGAAILTTLPHPKDGRPDDEHLQECVARLWLGGAPVDWHGYHAREQRARVPLPTYPFEGRRYWIEPAPRHHLRLPVRRADVDQWFYTPSWRRTSPLPTADVLSARWLVFEDGRGVGRAVAARLREQGVAPTVVSRGREFTRGDARFTIDPRAREHYESILTGLPADDMPLHIVHAWSIDADETDDPFYSVLFLAQAIAAAGRRTELGVLVANLDDVVGEITANPRAATAAGPALIGARELAELSARIIDIPAAETAADLQRLAIQLVAELGVAPEAQEIAYRGAHRWARTYEPLALRRPATSALREGGVYLITGGLGGIGLVLARHLATTCAARLVLTGRTEPPPRELWADILEAGDSHPAAAAVRAVLELEELGGDVLWLGADVADADAMRRVFQQARSRFGTVHGAIHAAGVSVLEAAARLRRDQAAATLAPKVEGTRILYDLLSREPFDFLLLCSSISAVMPTIGQTDYTSANLYLNAFARTTRPEHGRIISVGWDVWQETGMAAAAAAASGTAQAAHVVARGIRPTEGVDIFERVLAGRASEVIVSTADLPPILELLRSTTTTAPPPTSPAPAPSRAARASTDAGAVGERALHGELEEAIAAIWQDLLGIDVGPADDFFEAGGHSLLATQVMSRIYRRFGVDVPLRALFEARTVAGLAAQVEALLGAEAEREEIEI